MPTPSRSSRSGRHVASRVERTPTTPRPTPRRPAGRIAKTAVAVVLMVSVGNFAMAMPSDITQSPLMADVAGVRTQRAAAATAAEQVSTHHRDAVVAAAAAAAEQAQTVRTASATVVPAETLTQLAEAAAELDRLLAAAGAAVEPVATTRPAPTDLATTSPAPTDAATTSPAPTDAATAGPTAEPTAGAAEPSPAASAATDPSASPASAAPSDVTSASSAALDALAVVPAQVEDAATKELRTAAAKVAALTAEITQAVRDQQAATDASAAADAEAARLAAEEAATRSAQRVSLDQYANGQIPASALCPLSFATGAELRCDATAAIEQLNVAYRQQFGTDLVISDSYRSLSSQVACRRTKGSLCAVPGTSNHGLGKAVDLGGGAQSFGTTQHNWLVANAGAYGWALPAWAHAGGSKPEPWHWEYVD